MRVMWKRGLVLAAAALVAAGCASGNGKGDPVCGNGILEAGEECDEGPANSDLQPDRCRRLCTAPGCGDGVLDSGEECDDGNTVDNDGCGATCLREPQCGDGFLDPGEQCDDGNEVNGDGCSFICQYEFVCGDGACETAMSETCVLCPQDCCPCGDGDCDSAEGESCALCQVDCCPDCGDGVLGATEQCDDGNLVDGDGCSAACVDEDGQADCGNGLWEAGEECDDGNTADGDGCSAACQWEFVCGDATCESANGETCQLCPADCCPNCGDGVLDAGEQCDTADLAGQTCTGLCYTGGTLSCTAWCSLDTSACTGPGPACGDGVVECGEECDGSNLGGQACGDFGFAQGTLSCTAGCTMDTSGCGASLYYDFEDFEGGCPAGWTLSGDWQCGTPSGGGPSATHSGTTCLGTVISGSYNNNQSYAGCTADSPVIALPAGAEPYLSFYLWLQSESGFDGMNVKISTDGGGSFTQLADVEPPYTGTLSTEPAWYGNQSAAGWQQITADLAGYAGQSVVLRFAFRSDGSITYPGAYLDDVAIVHALTIPIAITTDPALPNVMVGDPYTQTLARTGGSAAALWSLVGGTNHAWLTLDPATGALSGTPAPTDAGPVSVTVRVEEPQLPSNFDERTFTFSVLTPDPLVITTDPALPPAWVGEPYAQTIQRTGGTLSAQWSLVGGTNYAWLSIDPGTGVLSGTPNPGDQGPTTVTVRVEEPLFPTNFTEQTFALSVGERIWGEGFDGGCPSGWSFGGDWQCGAPTSGPGAAYTGANCIATNLAGNYSNGQAWTTAVATSPVIDLTTAAAPHLSFYAWVYTEGNVYDGFNLKVSDDCVNYSLVTTTSIPYNLTVNGEPAWGGDQSGAGWQQVTADLSSHAGQTVCVRFAFRTDGSGTYAGVYLDEILLIEGLYVPLQITTPSPLPDADAGGPYTQTLTRTGGSPAAQWSIVGGTNHGWLTLDPATGELSGTPGPGDAGAVSVTVRVEEPSLPSNFDEATFAFTVYNVVWEQSFDAGCPAGWTLGGNWQCGTPTYGPGAAYDGASCLGTNLTGAYSNNQTWTGCVADSPPIDLSSTTAPQLRFRLWLYTEGNSYDGANVKVSTDCASYSLLNTDKAYNATVNLEQAWNGDQSASGWQLVTADLSAFAGQPAVCLRYAFRSDGSITYAGPYVDAIQIVD